MSRTSRQSEILSIISSKNIETQDELVAELRLAGFSITQATISRDIKELGLIKTLTADNKYKYVTKQTIDAKLSGKLMTVVREAVISVVTAENLVVIKTISDSASAVSSALEQLTLSEAVGIFSDRSAVLVVCSNARDAETVKRKINELL
ncbi:MAG: arginine repressor [Clostridiales bacterium]|nr:arginine repressor [Clostridiales bacterium]